MEDMKKPFPFGESVKKGWELFKEHAGFLVLVSLVYFAVSIGGSFLLEELNGALAFVGLVLYYVLTYLMSLGLVRILLNILDKKETSLGMLFSEGKHLINFFVAGILTGLAVLGGFILLIIPGIIFSFRFSQVTNLIVDKNMGAIEAMKMSWRITKGHVLDLFLFSLLISIVALIGLLALGVGLIVAIPVTMIAQMYVYRFLVNKYTGPVPGMSTPATPMTEAK